MGETQLSQQNTFSPSAHKSGSSSSSSSSPAFLSHSARAHPAFPLFCLGELNFANAIICVCALVKFQLLSASKPGIQSLLSLSVSLHATHINARSTEWLLKKANIYSYLHLRVYVGIPSLLHPPPVIPHISSRENQVTFRSPLGSPFPPLLTYS